jgi:hypothetical protein
VEREAAAWFDAQVAGQGCSYQALARPILRPITLDFPRWMKSFETSLEDLAAPHLQGVIEPASDHHNVAAFHRGRSIEKRRKGHDVVAPENLPQVGQV